MAGRRHTDRSRPTGRSTNRNAAARTDDTPSGETGQTGDWSDVLGDRARSATQPSATSPDPVPELPDDPVLAAMMELDPDVLPGEATVVTAMPPPFTHDNAAASPKPIAQLRRAPNAPRPTAEGGLDDRAGAARRLTLPRPDDAPVSTRSVLPEPAPAGDPTPPLTPVAHGADTDAAPFSSSGLMQRLQDEDGDGPPAADNPRAYRELYVTIGLAVLALSVTLLYQFNRSRPAPTGRVIPIETTTTPTSDPQTPTAPETAPRQDPARPAAPVVPNTPPAPPAPSARRPDRKAPKRPATPMLSIVSTPSGAIVDINGTVYGRTPLIIPGPRGESSLQITLKLPGHKKFSEVLTPNAAGHFSLSAKLEPR